MQKVEILLKYEWMYSELTQHFLYNSYKNSFRCCLSSLFFTVTTVEVRLGLLNGYSNIVSNGNDQLPWRITDILWITAVKF